MKASTANSMYRTLYEHSMDAVFLTAPDGRIFAANPAACEMFRLTEAQLCRQGRTGLVDEDDAAFDAYMAERAQKGKARGELTFIRGDGSRFLGEASSAQFTDDAGELRAALIIRDLTERMRMEHELSESRALLNAIVDSTEDLVCAIDMQSLTLLSFNRGLYDYFLHQHGIRLEKGMPIKGLFHSPSSAQQWHGFFERALQDGSFTTEYTVSSGSHVLQMNFHAFSFGDGLSGVSVFGRNITEHKRAEEELRESEQRYRTIFENSPIGLFRATLDGRYIEANPALAHIFGYETPEALVRAIDDIGKQLYVDEEDRKKVIARQLQTPGDSAVYLNRYRRRDGSECIANLYLKTIRDHEGEPVFFEGLVEDVTESKRKEDELRASEARFRIFVDHVSDALFMHGEGGIILDANRQACLNLGYSREELIGMVPAQFDAEQSPEVRALIGKQISKGEVVTFESHHRRKDGSTFPVEVSIRPFMDGDRRVQISSARDISERLQVEGDLRGLNRELRAITHCHQALLRTGEQQRLLNEICRIICDEAGYRMAWVGFVEQDEARLIRPMAWAGVEAGYLANANISWHEGSKHGQGPGAEAAVKGNIVYVQDIESDPRMEPWRDMALARGYRSSIAIPLKAGRKVFGILSIYAPEPHAFVLEEIRLLDELADDLAFGIEVLRMRREREQAKALLQAKKEELKASNRQLRRLTAHREDIREQERMNIARNVHDELGQLLTALQMKLSALELGFGKGNKQLSQEIASTQDLADKALKAARDVISALRPSSLDMGLAVSLEWLAQRYTASMGVPCEVRLVNWQDESVNEAALIALYRIAQESLTNIARHAHAGQATIVLTGLDEASQLSVRDNGRGFDPEHIKEDSFGLIGIRERVEMLGGTFAIDSKKGKGTELRVTIPVSMQQEVL